MSATPPPGIPSQVQIQIDWAGSETIPIMASNVFFVQQTPHEFIITFGAAAPPMRQITADEAKSFKLKPQTLARFAISPGRMVELMQLFQQQLQLFQRNQRQ